MATKQEIINVIADHVSKRGGNCSEWYVGIATEPHVRLFNDHSVDEKNGLWIHRLCVSSSDAREIEDYFIAKGMKGGPGGGDSDTKSVYAYKITSSTRE
jgi:hypothetical protein